MEMGIISGAGHWRVVAEYLLIGLEDLANICMKGLGGGTRHYPAALMLCFMQALDLKSQCVLSWMILKLQCLLWLQCQVDLYRCARKASESYVLV